MVAHSNHEGEQDGNGNPASGIRPVDGRIPCGKYFLNHFKSDQAFFAGT